MKKELRAAPPSAHGEAASIEREPGRLKGKGAWTLAHMRVLDEALRRPVAAAADMHFDLSGVTALDTAGAWLIRREVLRLEKTGASVRITGLEDDAQALLDRVSAATESEPVAETPRKVGLLERVGRQAVSQAEQLFAYLAFVGEVASTIWPLLLKPWRIRWRRVLHNLEIAGVNALPIVGMLAFLMGVVIAYQGSIPLQKYGASIYVADLVGLAMLRELAPIITAIIVAGRTGAAYTAEIGAMKVNEEIDALQVMGVPPIEVLVLPKLIALTIALPLLTVFADVLGLAGGMLMAQMTLDVAPQPFLDELLRAVGVESYLIGIGKAPVFAVIIASVGCFQGFQVAGSAESVGRHTTTSVVQAIFLVIVVDAAFSVVFSALGI